MFKKIFLALAIICPMLASAQTLKIGIVDSNAIIGAMPETTAAQTQLTELKNKCEATYNKLGEELQRTYAEFQKMSDSELPAIRDQKAREIQDQQQKLQVFEQQSMADLQKKQEELMQPIIAKMKSAIESVARENGFSLVQDNVSQITFYFADPVVDITPMVKTKLGLK
ncbi:MAG: OmpH family outer membrane protein [Muribaculaceae bacterium]|nr:OmpH family outer membrane protein [Muribaculaceae bacterium]